MAGQNKTNFCNYFLGSITLLSKTSRQTFVHSFHKEWMFSSKAPQQVEPGGTADAPSSSYWIGPNRERRGSAGNYWQGSLHHRFPPFRLPRPTHDLVNICGWVAELPSPPAAASRRGWHLLHPHSWGVCCTDWGEQKAHLTLHLFKQKQFCCSSLKALTWTQLRHWLGWLSSGEFWVSTVLCEHCATERNRGTDDVRWLAQG